MLLRWGPTSNYLDHSPSTPLGTGSFTYPLAGGCFCEPHDHGPGWRMQQFVVNPYFHDRDVVSSLVLVVLGTSTVAITDATWPY